MARILRSVAFILSILSINACINTDESATGENNPEPKIDVDAEFSLGSRHSHLGNDSIALIHFNRVLTYDTIHYYYYSARGESHFQLSHLDSALYDYTKAIELCSNRPYDLEQFYSRRADIYFGEKMYVECFLDLNKSIEINKDSVENQSFHMKEFYSKILKGRSESEYLKVMETVDSIEQLN